MELLVNSPLPQNAENKEILIKIWGENHQPSTLF